MSSPEAQPEPAEVIVRGAFVPRATTAYEWGPALFLLIVLGTVGAVFAGQAGSFASFAAIAGLAALGYAGFRATRPTPQHATLRANRVGLWFGDAPIAKREDVLSATATASRKGGVVRVLRRGIPRPLVLVVRDLDSARAVVDALDLDVHGTTVEARAATGFGSVSSSLVLRLLVALLGILTLIAVAVHPLLGLASLLLSGALLWPSTYVAGADGVLRRGLLTRRFIPIADIARVQCTPSRVRLRLRSGRTHDVPIWHGDDVFRARGDRMVTRAALFAERIEAALERDDRRAPPLDPSKLARPADMPAAAWMQSLSELASDQGTFRQPATTPEQLWDVVDDGSAAAASRAAAAVALRATLDDHGRQRLRLAAESTAAPHLRVAFERAAESDDAPLAEALDDLARIER